MFLYSLLLGTGLAVSSPWWLMRMVTTRRYRAGLRERLGNVPARLRSEAKGRRIVWVHAVSVGEVLAAARLVHELETTLNAGGAGDPWRVVVSTTTQTGQALARERFGAERVFWFPLDFAWAVRAWLFALRPRMVVLVESELWPRLLAECARQEIPVAVVNARLSDRSFRRAVRMHRLWSRVLGRVSLFLAQSDETAERLRALRVVPARVRTAGNLKYDLQPQATEMSRLLRPMVARRALVVAGSLLEPEERLLLDRWHEICRDAPPSVLLLAPRHPERFDAIAAMAEGRFPFHRARQLAAAAHSGAIERLPPCAVVLLDTVGDLAAVYGLADVAFVGGSLVAKGGHNPLEPASLGVPVLMGSSFQNFREIVTEMQADGGIQIVDNADELALKLNHLLQDRVAADELGQRGLRVFERKRGATARSVEALVNLVQPQRTAVAGGERA